MKTCFWWVAALCSAVVLLNGSNAAEDYEDVVNKIDLMVDSILKCKPHISGLSLAVVKDGTPIIQKGYGVANRELGLNATKDTLFQIASLSKAFTTTLLMKILEKIPNITVNTVVTEVLKGDFQFGDDQLNKYATIQDLMSHRLGLPTHNYIRFENMTREELARRFRYIKPIGEFRSTYYYNNLVYGLLTHITEVLGKDTWENLMKREIFDPLGMRRSTFAHTLDPDDMNVALGYGVMRNGDFDKIPKEISTHWGKLGGSGSVMSTAEEMTNWMILHLNQGKDRNNTEVIKKATIQANHKAKVVFWTSINRYITVPEMPTTFNINGYAAAWRNGFYRGVPTISHTGSTFGYRAILMLYPDQDLGIFINLNGDDKNVWTRTALQSYIADLFLEHRPWLNTTTICTFPKPWHHVSSSRPDPPIDKTVEPTFAVDTYVGKYFTPLYGTMEISKPPESKCSNCLELTLGIATFDLYPSRIMPHMFDAEGTGAVNFWKSMSIKFNVPEGESRPMSLQPLAFDYRDPPEFKRVERSTDFETSSVDTKLPDDITLCEGCIGQGSTHRHVLSGATPVNSQWTRRTIFTILLFRLTSYVI